VAGWQVHLAAAELHTEQGDSQRADLHWAAAAELVMRIADSFAGDEPLRESLLSAPPVRRILVRRSGRAAPA
jgi:hypothetical protein